MTVTPVRNFVLFVVAVVVAAIATGAAVVTAFQLVRAVFR